MSAFNSQPTPWQIRRRGAGAHFVTVEDANGDPVCSTGNTETGRQTMQRLVELANRAPSVEAAVDASFDRIVRGQ